MPDISVAGAIAAGVFSFASPCVLPLAPGYIGFLAGSASHASHDAGGVRVLRPLGLGLTFVVGFSTVFVALGAPESTIGALLSRSFDRLAIVAGALIVALGLLRLGAFTVLSRTRDRRAAPRSWAGFVVGMAFAFGWTPCVGPALATILVLTASPASQTWGVALLSAYALGLGLPFLLAAAALAPLMARLAVTPRLRGALLAGAALMLIATGVLIATGALERVAAWLLDVFPALGGAG